MTSRLSPYQAFIALGSSIGSLLEKKLMIEGAIRLLQSVGQVRYTSAFYLNYPVGGVAENRFLNGALVLATALKPHQLLCELLNFEAKLGRVRQVPNEDRLIDLDILFVLHQSKTELKPLQIKTEHLIVPHGKLTERAFMWWPFIEVLAPLSTITPLGHEAQLMLDQLTQEAGAHALADQDCWYQKVVRVSHG
ncbi:MAG: 2-amino-4-hydroxy-6-hydroxymethyldihydropteridine diphosphokinase [Proteobacteria bacterium]|nr:2-amino-4-hydroxy-6-hydroxymethyldihydropteridine diphosphokinase [Pseudomonadota bacterium]